MREINRIQAADISLACRSQKKCIDEERTHTF
jgi:hypothetical protein